MESYIKKNLFFLLAVGIAVVVLHHPGVCYSQEPSINIGGISITKGMDKQTVINKLKKFNKLACFTDDHCMVYGGGSEGGSIFFEGEKVDSVRVGWETGYSQTSLEQFFDTLFSLLKNFEEQGLVILGLQLEEKRDPKVSTKHISLLFDGKTVEIGSVNLKFWSIGSKNTATVTLVEMLE